MTCISADDCWAVGDFKNADGNEATLIEQYAGSGWNVVSSPTLSDGGSLFGVTCLNADDCWAVGQSGPQSGQPQPLIEQDTGSGWATVSTPTPPGPTAVLEAVACATTTECWAVGNYSTDDAPLNVLIEEFTGTSWDVVDSAIPSSITDSGLASVACANADDCWAVGSIQDTAEESGDLQPLIEQDTGGGWTIFSSPNPSGGANLLESVACVDGTDCSAVGYITNGASSSQALIEQYTGAGWGIASSPAAANPDFGLESVSCVDTNDCWAVGYADAGSNDTMLIERESASGWTIAANPPADLNTYLSSVACIGADDCWAVGSTFGGSGLEDGQALIVQYS
ncbi:MAG: hypothetical protein ACLQGJ_03960 [Candidatus Dormibacteria bacterium]